MSRRLTPRSAQSLVSLRRVTASRGRIPLHGPAKGIEVGHAEPSVGFSTAIPEKFTSKTEYANTQQDLTGSWYT
jgi:hypothetical protein